MGTILTGLKDPYLSNGFKAAQPIWLTTA